jgi:TPR repeat protein
VKPTGSSTANPKTELAAKSGAPADAGIGQEEFNAAREILRGSNRQRELPRAVALLWAGVRQGYVPAEVTLADLFRRGDGVQKNCDQARVLLVAASKKGSFEARQMLEQIAERGCE